MKKVLKKISEEIRQDKNGKNYKYTTFSGLDAEYMDIPGVGRTVVSMKNRETTINLYEESYLNQKEQYAYSLPIGSFCFGSIETRFVSPYDLPDNTKGAPKGAMKTINTFSCIVFGDSTAPTWENTVRQEIKARGHIVQNSPAGVEEESILHVEDKTKKAA